MKFDPIFVVNILGIFLAFGIVARAYVWPKIRTMPKNQALRILIAPHLFRFVGLSFLIVGVVSPSLSHRLSSPAAWGDFGASILALAAFYVLNRRTSFAIPLVWVFNIWGTLDLLYAYYNGLTLHLEPGLLGAAYFIPTFIVPLLLTLHALIFMLLLKAQRPRIPVQQ